MYSKNLGMDANFNQIYDFLFNSFGGIGVLVLTLLAISVIAGFALERRTQKLLDERKRRAAETFKENIAAKDTKIEDEDEGEQTSSVEKIDKNSL
ncbi:MAG: hypothetical protein HUJ51_01180 [Eggerthellaceae bacterium]|nr:hypothetical protein [Eggerthellaceae bacterium]